MIKQQQCGSGCFTAEYGNAQWDQGRGQGVLQQGYAHPVMQLGVLDGVSRSGGEAVQSLNCAL